MARTVYFPNIFRQLACFVGVATLVAAAAQAAEPAPMPMAERSAQGPKETLSRAPASAKVSPGLAGSFLSGRFARQNQDVKEAAKYLSDTLAHDPENEQLIAETMRMQLLAGDVAAATELAHRLEAFGSKGADAVQASLLMLEAVKSGSYVQAKKAIEQSSGAGLFGLIRPALLEWLALGAGERKAPIDLKSAIEKAGFFAPFMNYQAALMNDVAGDTNAAQVAYAKANADPAVTPYRVVEALANFYARQGKWSEAQAAYDAYASANPQSSLIPDKLKPAGPVPKPLVANAKEGLAELYFTTASILFGEDAAQDTFLYLRIALDLRPNFPPAQLMLANLYEQIEDYKQAITTYDAIPEGSVFYHRAQVRKALNLEALGQKDKAISLLEGLAKRYPNEAMALITKGDMERDAKRYSDAADTYSQAIARTEPLKPSDWPLLYARGISYERTGIWNKAESDFLRALELEPEQPDVLNYLGYSWLVMNKNLTQAKDYLELAASARPEDPHIIDSVGWAYYLTGDYAKAVEQFERAIEMMPDDPTVNEHLGDAYFRVGRETEARYQWERALTFKPEPEVAEAIEQKLEKGLPPAAAAVPEHSSAVNLHAPNIADSKVR